MNLKKSDAEASTTPKVKKPIVKRWWFRALVVVFVCCVIAPFLPKSEPTAANPSASPAATPLQGGAALDLPVASSPVDASPTPEDTEATKDAAKAVDAEISTIYASAEKDYTAFLDILSNGSSSDLDAYDNAKTLKKNINYYNYTQLSAVEGDGIDTYKDSVAMYLFMMTEVADKAIDYLDDPVTSKLSKYKEAVESVNTYMYGVVANRLSFLSEAGFTAEEIDSLSSPETGE